MNKLFEDNLELVDSVMSYHISTNNLYANYVGKDDLRQEVYIYIDKYIDKYNKDKGSLKNWVNRLAKYAVGYCILKYSAKKRSNNISLFSTIDIEENLRLLDTIESNITYHKFDDLDIFEFFPPKLFSKRELEVIDSIILSTFNFKSKSSENARMRIVNKCKRYINNNKGLFNTNEYISIDNVFKGEKK